MNLNPNPLDQMTEDPTKGTSYPLMLHENELRIITTALNLLSKADESQLDKFYGKVSVLYEKLAYYTDHVGPRDYQGPLYAPHPDLQGHQRKDMDLL